MGEIHPAAQSRLPWHNPLEEDCEAAARFPHCTSLCCVHLWPWRNRQDLSPRRSWTAVARIVVAPLEQLNFLLQTTTMGESKQVQLNGAYYGPPVPPQQAYRSIGRRSSSCGPCCLLCTLLKFIISIAVTVGVIVLVIWLVFRPNKLEVYIENASLSQFNLTSNSTLTYNLAVDLSIRNPNRRLAFYYDTVETAALYGGSQFGYEVFPAFYQGHKNTTVLHPAFMGQAAAVGSSVAGTFDREKGEGFFYLEVKLYTSLRLKAWFVKIGHYKPKIDCFVKLPVPSKGNSTASFERTKCDLDLF